MPSPVLITDVTNRCLAAAARCVKAGNGPEAVQAMKAELRLIAMDVAQWQLTGEAKARVLLRPLEQKLVNEYGAHQGRRLYWDQLDAFWIQSWSTSPLPVVDTDSDSSVRLRIAN